MELSPYLFHACIHQQPCLILCPQVLQRSVDRELNLYSEVKDHSQVVAQVVMLSLSSQPVDHEENGRRKLPTGDGNVFPNSTT